jgi:hypothetical protein
MGCGASAASVSNDAPLQERSVSVLKVGESWALRRGFPEDVCDSYIVTLMKDKGTSLGVSLGGISNCGLSMASSLKSLSGAVILNIKEGGLMDEWNSQNPLSQLEVGHTITAANGVRGHWNILEELGKEGVLEMEVRRTPLESRWQSDIARLVGPAGVKEQQSPLGSLTLCLPTNPDGSLRSPDVDSVVSLPRVAASDIGATHCCICVEDLAPDDKVVQLPCKHGFHSVCAARWLTQGRQVNCPLCKRSVLGDEH